MPDETTVKITVILLAVLLLLGGGCVACNFVLRTTQDADAPK
jgi:hypothetical protein